MHRSTLLIPAAVAAVALTATLAPAAAAPRAESAKPKPAVRFAALLKGRMFRQFQNSAEPGGVQSEKTIHFCSNGRFFFSSIFVLATDGGGQTERKNTTGRWKVVRARFDAVGDAIGVVRLVPRRGKAELLEIIVSSQGSALNRERAFRVRSTRCR